MNKQKIWDTKLIQRILWLMMVSAFLFFVFRQVLLPAENNTEESTFRVFQSEWERVMPDGARMPVSVPGECGAQRGDWVVIATALPQDQEDTYICVRSMQPELKIYEADAGSTLRIEFMSDSAYAGYVQY